jgi:hypothetical protein
MTVYRGDCRINLTNKSEQTLTNLNKSEQTLTNLNLKNIFSRSLAFIASIEKEQYRQEKSQEEISLQHTNFLLLSLFTKVAKEDFLWPRSLCVTIRWICWYVDVRLLMRMPRFSLTQT